ncbi:hypothetical protein EJ06DRAFT_549656 [Trichodelitschia bisporula]|uniref:Amino acid transporter n=1 Tax=Trichodelitschia bisporula TaxID=703511 RepID=A0A6G1HU85_9PEZI|nr:hypothetical protein EJ06DRAFT_549656 [Trichodelitschia bisporula]
MKSPFLHSAQRPLLGLPSPFSPRASFSSLLNSPCPEKLTLHTPLLSPHPFGPLTPKTPRTPSAEYNTFPAPSSTRHITWWSAYFLIISRVIGSGIFAAPGVIAVSAGSIGLTIVLWLIGALVAACGLAVSLELGCMLPRSGGEKIYLEFMYPHPRFLTSTIVAAQATLLGFTASNALIFGKYLLFALDLPPTDGATRACAAGLILAVTAIHTRFLRGGIALQNALGWIKILVLAFMVAAGFSALLFPPPVTHHTPPPPAPTSIWAGSSLSLSTLAPALLQVSYAYSGTTTLNTVLDEVQHPIRTLRTAAPAALATICLFYTLLNAAYLTLIPISSLRSNPSTIAALFFARLFSNTTATRLLPLLVALSAAGSAMVTAFAQSRVNAAVARGGFLPYAKTLAAPSRWGTPAGGLALHAAASLAVILLPPRGAAYAFILQAAGYPAQATTLARVKCGDRTYPVRRLMRMMGAWLMHV